MRWIGLASVAAWMAAASLAVSALPWGALVVRVSPVVLAAAAGVLAVMTAGLAVFIWKGRSAMPHFHKTLVLLIILGAVVLVPAGLWVRLVPGPARAWIVDRFGPVKVSMSEAYAADTAGEKFDHEAWDALLKQHVDAHGWIDYDGFDRASPQLDAYIKALADADFDALGRDEKLAFLINAYNAFTIRLILDYRDGGKLGSIFDIPEEKRWDHQRWRLARQTVSLNQLEHEIIRPRFKEPRIHFALVCAAVGCPPLRTEAYTGQRLEKQLASQSEYAHANDRWLRFDPESGKLQLTALYEWYADDFKQSAGSVLDYVAGQSEEVAAARDSGRPIRISYLDYSWALNDVGNRPRSHSRPAS